MAITRPWRRCARQADYFRTTAERLDRGERRLELSITTRSAAMPQPSPFLEIEPQPEAPAHALEQPMNDAALDRLHRQGSPSSRGFGPAERGEGSKRVRGLEVGARQARKLQANS